MFSRVLARRWLPPGLLLFACWLTPSKLSAYHEPGHEWVERSAYTLAAGELSLGLRQWAVGVLDEVQVGVSPVLWLAGPFFHSLIPNGEIKVRDFLHDRVAVAASFGFLYMNGTRALDTYASRHQAHANLLAFTASLASSVRITDAVSGSLEASYTELDVSGSDAEASIAGTALVSSLRLGAVADYRLSRVVALRLSGLVLLHRGSPELQVSFQADPRTHVAGELRIGESAPLGAWQLMPAIVLSGAHVNFLAGAGYGYQWLPFCGLVLPARGVVFDLDFFVRF